MALLFDPVFFVLVGLLVLLYRLSAFFVLSHRLLDGLRFWAPPSNADIAKLVPAVVDSYDQSKRDREEKAKARRKLTKKQLKEAKEQGELEPEVKEASVPTLKPSRRRKLLKNKKRELPLEQKIISGSLFVGLETFEQFDTVVLMASVCVAVAFCAEMWACVTLSDIQSFAFTLVAIGLLHEWYSLWRLLLATGYTSPQALLCYIVAVFFFVVSFAIGYFPSLLDVDLDENTYTSFVGEIDKSLAAQGVKFRWKVPFWMIRVCFSAAVGGLGAMMFLPARRFVASYQFILSHWRPDQNSLTGYFRWVRVALHVSTILPVITILFWVVPLTRDLLVGDLGGADAVKISEESFRSIRFYLTIVTVGLRLFLARPVTQAYLFEAHDRVMADTTVLNTESGKHIQTYLTRVCTFSPVAMMQFIACGIVLPLMYALLWKWKSIDLGVCSALVGTEMHTPDSWTTVSVGNNATQQASAQLTRTVVGYVRDWFGVTSNVTGGLGNATITNGTAATPDIPSAFSMFHNPLTPVFLDYMSLWVHVCWTTLVALLWYTGRDGASGRAKQD